MQRKHKSFSFIVIQRHQLWLSFIKIIYLTLLLNKISSIQPNLVHFENVMLIGASNARIKLKIVAIFLLSYVYALLLASETDDDQLI